MGRRPADYDPATWKFKCCKDGTCYLHSPEKRRKMSEAMKGVNKGKVCLESCTCPRHNKTQEHRDKIAATLTGQRHPEDCQCAKHKDRPLGSHIRSTDGYREIQLTSRHLLSNSRWILEHRKVLWDKLGCEQLDCTHQCHWCDKDIVWCSGDWHTETIADHLDGDKLNNDPDNIVPSCQQCNRNRDNPRGFCYQGR